MLKPLLERLDGADHVEALARAARAGNDAHAAAADAEALQDLIADANLFLRLRRERHADRVADPRPQQRADADRRLDGPADQAAGLGHAEVERAIDLARELLVGGDREEHVGGFDRDLVVPEIMVLQNADMVERAFDQRFRAGLAIFFEQVLFEAAGIDPDADRAAIGAAAAITSRTRSSEPMLPGLMRRHAAPASAASSARL